MSNGRRVVRVLVWNECRLREYRIRKAMSQRDVASACGLSPSIIHQIENGADLCLSTARRICKALGTSEQVLWPGTGFRDRSK